jgi:hypothetical protein
MPAAVQGVCGRGQASNVCMTALQHFKSKHEFFSVIPNTACYSAVGLIKHWMFVSGEKGQVLRRKTESTTGEKFLKRMISNAKDRRTVAPATAKNVCVLVRDGGSSLLSAREAADLVSHFVSQEGKVALYEQRQAELEAAAAEFDEGRAQLQRKVDALEAMEEQESDPNFDPTHANFDQLRALQFSIKGLGQALRAQEECVELAVAAAQRAHAELENFGRPFVLAEYVAPRGDLLLRAVFRDGTGSSPEISAASFSGGLVGGPDGGGGGGDGGGGKAARKQEQERERERERGGIPVPYALQVAFPPYPPPRAPVAHSSRAPATTPRPCHRPQCRLKTAVHELAQHFTKQRDSAKAPASALRVKRLECEFVEGDANAAAHMAGAKAGGLSYDAYMKVRRVSVTGGHVHFRHRRATSVPQCAHGCTWKGSHSRGTPPSLSPITRSHHSLPSRSSHHDQHAVLAQQRSHSSTLNSTLLLHTPNCCTHLTVVCGARRVVLVWCL